MMCRCNADPELLQDMYRHLEPPTFVVSFSMIMSMEFHHFDSMNLE